MWTTYIYITQINTTKIKIILFEKIFFFLCEINTVSDVKLHYDLLKYLITNNWFVFLEIKYKNDYVLLKKKRFA